ncbi:hypothetical protein MIDIC_590010 [Alphaproteobacteria bacterium]
MAMDGNAVLNTLLEGVATCLLRKQTFLLKEHTEGKKAVAALIVEGMLFDLDRKLGIEFAPTAIQLQFLVDSVVMVGATLAREIKKAPNVQAELEKVEQNISDLERKCMAYDTEKTLFEQKGG